MPSNADILSMSPARDVSTSPRSPFAAVILRVPDLNCQAAPAAHAKFAATRIEKLRDRLPSASSFLKGLTSRVLLAAIALTALVIFYVALNGTSPPAKPAQPANNIPLISSRPTNKPPTATVLLPDKASNNGLFQDLPRPASGLPPATESNANSNLPGSVDSPSPPANVQPIRSVPAANPGPVLLGPTGDQAAMHPASLETVARREVFSWGAAEFSGAVEKAPLGTAFVPTQHTLK